MRGKIQGENFTEIHPWFKGFTGKIIKNADNYTIKGRYEVQDDDLLRIYELPIGR